MSLSTYQVHPAILLVSLVLQVEPIVPHQQANPWILPRFQNLLQKYLKFLVWNEVYEQFVVFLFKKGKDTTVSRLHEKFKVQNQQNLLLGRGVLRKRGHFTRASQSPEPSQSVCSEKYIHLREYKELLWDFNTTQAQNQDAPWLQCKIPPKKYPLTILTQETPFTRVI